jgi:hypothetical protein
MGFLEHWFSYRGAMRRNQAWIVAIGVAGSTFVGGFAIAHNAARDNSTSGQGSGQGSATIETVADTSAFVAGPPSTIVRYVDVYVNDTVASTTPSSQALPTPEAFITEPAETAPPVAGDPSPDIATAFADADEPFSTQATRLARESTDEDGDDNGDRDSEHESDDGDHERDHERDHNRGHDNEHEQSDDGRDD